MYTACVAYGLGNQFPEALKYGQLPLSEHIEYVADAFNGWSIVAGRCSVIAFLLAIQGRTRTNQRVFLWFLGVTNVSSIRAPFTATPRRASKLTSFILPVDPHYDHRLHLLLRM